MNTEDTTPAAPTPHMEQMRSHLMDTLAALRDRDNPMEPDRARAIAQVAGVLVDSAKVEVDYIRATGAPKSAFIEPQLSAPHGTSDSPTPHNPFPRVTRHTLAG